jgi:hypothetical protein
MAYRLFLDDLRDPPDGTWVVARSVAEATSWVRQHGMPGLISFDHDLGPEAPTGHDFAKWLVDCHLDGTHLLPADFAYTVHSANPPGALNISGLLDRFLRHLAGE